MARFQQRIMKHERTVLASVERLGELHDGRGPWKRSLHLTLQ
jgi:hypothetical protein